MNTPPSLPQELWDRTSPEMRAYIKAWEARPVYLGELEARVVTLEAMVETCNNSCTRLRGMLHGLHRVIRPSIPVRVALEGNTAEAGHQGIQAIPAPCSL